MNTARLTYTSSDANWHSVEVMARKRFQQRGHLRAENGYWKLRWREDRIPAAGEVKRGWSPTVTIGPAPGNRSLKPMTEKEARREAWLRSSDTQQQAPAVSGHLTAERCTSIPVDPGRAASEGPESPQNSLNDEKGSALNAGPNREQALGVQTLDRQADPIQSLREFHEHR